MEINKKIHFIGIGGIGMSGIAKVLIEKGFRVSGSDVKESSITKALREYGATINIGHREENVQGADIVVRSTAISEDNPEIVGAQKKRIEILHRAKILGMLLNEKESIGITGTHGKGTVSAMISYILDGAGDDVSFIIGGILNNYGTNAKSGSGSFIVAEIDESDGSLLQTKPDYVVLNNIERDHLNYYKNFENIINVLSQFIHQNNKKKRIYINSDDYGAKRVVMNINDEDVVKFGFNKNAHYRGIDLSISGKNSFFKVLKNGKFYGQFELKICGIHNIANSLAAISVCDSLGIKKEIIQERLSKFEGLKNRFTISSAGKNLVIKDYISHPTGIKRVLEATRTITKGRIYAVFKPYRFTMINYLQNEYRDAFRDADFTVVTEMWDAGETPIPGIDTMFLVNKIRSSNSRVEYIKEMKEIIPFLMGELKPDDTALFFGGDDLFEIADNLMKKLTSNY